MDRAVAQRRSADEQVAADEQAGPALGLANRLSVRVPADPRQLRGMRRRVEAWADAHDIGAVDLIDLQLALGEAVSNGMEHAYAAGTAGAEVEIELGLQAGLGRAEDLGSRAVSVLVRDRGRWRQASSRPSTRGRGLAMIEALAGELRVTSNARGTAVTFTLPLRD